MKKLLTTLLTLTLLSFTNQASAGWLPEWLGGSGLTEQEEQEVDRCKTNAQTVQLVKKYNNKAQQTKLVNTTTVKEFCIDVVKSEPVNSFFRGVLTK